MQNGYMQRGQYRSKRAKKNRIVNKLSFWLLAAAFAGITVFVTMQPVNNLDNNIAAFIQGWESDSLTPIMKFFTVLGSTKVSILIAAVVLGVLYLIYRKLSEPILFAAALGGAAAMNVLFKQIFSRPRPEVHRLIEETGFSYPSGHTMGAMALYGAIAFLLWRHADKVWKRTLIIIGTIILVIMIAVSRIYLGVHYPSDITGGILASGIWLSIVIGIYQWMQEKRA